MQETGDPPVRTTPLGRSEQFILPALNCIKYYYYYKKIISNNINGICRVNYKSAVLTDQLVMVNKTIIFV